MSNVTGKSDVTPTESKTTSTVGNFSHGSRETPVISVSSKEAERSEKARGHNSDMHVIGESHSSIVPEKPANKGWVPKPAESVEGRGLTKENTEQLLLDRTQSRETDGKPFVARSRGLLGVREAVCTSTSEVRAVCGSSARTDLCGGRSAMTVPTAIGARKVPYGALARTKSEGRRRLALASGFRVLRLCGIDRLGELGHGAGRGSVGRDG